MKPNSRIEPGPLALLESLNIAGLTWVTPGTARDPLINWVFDKFGIPFIILLLLALPAHLSLCSRRTALLHCLAENNTKNTKNYVCVLCIVHTHYFVYAPSYGRHQNKILCVCACALCTHYFVYTPSYARTQTNSDSLSIRCNNGDFPPYLSAYYDSHSCPSNG